MKRRTVWLSAGCTAALITMAWPGPAQGTTSLGGYTGVAYASVVHVAVYEPTIPIPAEPQGDVSIGYAKSVLDTGPSTRATASYLWPGDVVGDGFDQLLKQPGKTYPVQVNSRYPATQSAPEHNRAQLTDGNGMATSTDGDTTKASVTLLGLAGPDTNLLGGVLTGLQQLGGKPPTTTATKPAPLPVSSALAGLMTVKNVTSDTTIKLSDKSVTSTAHAAASNISLLGGLISIEGIDVTSQVVTDGAKATPSGTAKIGAVKIAGITLGLSDQGIDLGAGTVKLPVLSSTVNNALRLLGISVSTMPVKKNAQGATGDFSAQGLVISIDTAPLKNALNGPLGAIISTFPQSSQSQLAVLLNLGPKLVLTVGNVAANASASPGYEGGFGPSPAPGGSDDGSGSAGTGGDTGGGTGSGGDTGGIGGEELPGFGGDSGPIAADDNTTFPPTAGGGETIPPMTVQPVMHLPPLGAVPRMLILGSLALAAFLGWGMRTAGAFLLGGARSCNYGLATGVPDLRKG